MTLQEIQVYFVNHREFPNYCLDNTCFICKYNASCLMAKHGGELVTDVIILIKDDINKNRDSYFEALL